MFCAKSWVVAPRADEGFLNNVINKMVYPTRCTRKKRYSADMLLEKGIKFVIFTHMWLHANATAGHAGDILDQLIHVLHRTNLLEQWSVDEQCGQPVCHRPHIRGLCLNS